MGFAEGERMIPMWYLDDSGRKTGEEVWSVKTLADTAEFESENGVYMVANTTRNGHVLLLDRHFDRMERSATTLEVPIHIPRFAIRERISEMLREIRQPDGRFRVTAVLDTPIRYTVSIEPFAGPPKWIKTEGVETVVLRNTVRLNPEVKSTEWLISRGQVDAYEGLLCAEDGSILEGTSSNFYAIVPSAEGRVQLHTAERGVLSGISRSIVLTVAFNALAVNGEPIHYDDLVQVQEAFLSSATRGIVPIKRIDEVELRAPGPYTLQLMDLYERWVEEHLEPLLPPAQYEEE